MNCCNSYGQCTQATDCAARKPTDLVARVAPEEQIPEVSGWQAFKWLAISVVIIAMLAWVALWLVMIGQKLGQLL